MQAVLIAGAGMTVVGKLFDLYDEACSDPKLRVEALQKLKQESDAEHQKSMNRLEQNRKSMEELARKQEEAANERVRTQRDENNKIIEALRKQSKEQDDKYEQQVKKMNEEHVKKMEKLRSEDKETREKAEMEHKIKLGEVEKEHKNEKIEAQKKLEKTKIEGARKIEEAEKQKEKVDQERSKALVVYHDEMKKMNEIYQKQVQEINKRNRMMRIENAKERKNQLKIQNEEITKRIKSDTEKLLGHYTGETSIEVVAEFRALSEPFYAVEDSLKNIAASCVGETPSIAPGTLDPDFSGIKDQANKFNYRVKAFRQFVLRTNFTDPQLYKLCSDYISKMDVVMSGSAIKEICAQLPKAIDDGNAHVIKKYRNAALNLSERFSALHIDSENGTNQVEKKYVTAENTNQKSIGR